MSGVRDFVLANYPDGTGHLATLHVFVNFADQWAHTSPEARRRLRIVRDRLEEVTGTSPSWSALRLGVAATQLCPNKKAWEEADRALHHFGADLVA